MLQHIKFWSGTLILHITSLHISVHLKHLWLPCVWKIRALITRLPYLWVKTCSLLRRESVKSLNFSLEVNSVQYLIIIELWFSFNPSDKCFTVSKMFSELFRFSKPSWRMNGLSTPTNQSWISVVSAAVSSLFLLALSQSFPVFQWLSALGCMKAAPSQPAELEVIIVCVCLCVVALKPLQQTVV